MEESALAFAELIIYFVILCLTLYGLALGYHWFSYGASRKTSMTAVIIYISGCIALIIGLVAAYNFL